MQVPQDIKALRQEGALQITWSDGEVARLRFTAVREACTCAQCVDEITGERILDPATIPPDITIENLQLVGNYALRISWSDGHSTGLYTWPLLRSLSHG